MKNKTKIIVGAFVALIVILLLVFIFTKKDDTTPSIGNDVVTPTLSLEITKIPHSILTSTPKVDKEEIIPTAPIVSDDNNEDKPNKDDIPNFDDGQEATPNPTPQVSEAPKASPTPQISEEPKATSTPIPTQKVEVTPTLAPTSTPKPTSTPIPTKAPSVNGKVELESLGISIPKRDTFNSEALVDSSDSAWYGDVDDTESGQALIDMLVSVNQALEDQGIASNDKQKFLIQDYAITFDWLMKGASSNFKLTRDTTNGEFILEINTPLDSYTTSWGKEVGEYNRDIVKTLLSCVVDGNDIDDVYSTIYTYLYEDASILSGKTYKEVGNCKLLVDKEASWISSDYQNFSMVFKIKSN